MDIIPQDGQTGLKDSAKLNETGLPRPNELLSLTEDDISAVMGDIDLIHQKLDDPSVFGGFGMVFDKVIGWGVKKADGEIVRVAIKKPRSVKAEKIESDMSRMQQRLLDAGEFRFAPTYRLPEEEILVQRLIITRPWGEFEQDEFWKNITQQKSFSVSQFDDNVLCDKKLGPIIIDVLNVHF